MNELKLVARIDLSCWDKLSLVRIEKYPTELYYGHLNSRTFYDVTAENLEKTGTELLDDLISGKLQAIVFHDWYNTGSVKVKGYVLENNNFLTLVNNSLFLGKLGEINFPEEFVAKVSNEVFINFSKELETIVNKWFDESIVLLGQQEDFKFEAKEVISDQEHIESAFHISAVNTLDTTKWRENGSDFEEFEASYFEVSLSVYNLTYTTLVAVNDVYLPKLMRQQGRFTNLLTTIKDFLAENKLGDEIIMSDASEDGITDYVAEQLGLWCTSFGHATHNLYTEVVKNG